MFQLLTVDPTLEQLGLPGYPTLPGDTDPSKVEEIRRTIYVGNLPKGVNGQDVVDFFSMYVGDVGFLFIILLPCCCRLCTSGWLKVQILFPVHMRMWNFLNKLQYQLLYRITEQNSADGP